PNIVEKGQVVITGKAPNTQKVNININGRSYDFNVSSTSDNRFSTSQLTIDKGINRITFKVFNGGQVVETTREIAFYNGEVTYYNLRMSDSNPTGAQNVEFEPSLNFLTNSDAANYIKVHGTAIIPLPLYDAANPNVDLLGNAQNLAPLLKMELERDTTGTVNT